ncbi:hypothetical protein BMI91_19590 [Thioclava sediminum]|uniref:Tip attachment protein J domain-containing protein n=1 Tax=Thioclava sediminum TaxID=1915319 RepID=A0ABX3MSV6_9RHOB|nr:hypothetical protein [Thioclava sediminum]OOY22487.1 hypothetical protein BMI91_19590 [Thioclava sediminum]
MYLAIVDASDEFDASVHSRNDLTAYNLEISQAESELALMTLDIDNPRTSLSGIVGERVLASESGVLLFDGVVSSVPRGSVAETLSIEVTGKRGEVDQQIAAVIESLKVAPGYDPLFIPDGSEDDPAEVLAGYSKVLAYSRTGGGVAAVDALSGASNLQLMPLDGSLQYDRSDVAKTFGVSLGVRWKQLISTSFRDDGWFSGLSTMTPEAFASDFPKEGGTIGDGFRITHAVCKEQLDGFGRQQREKLEREIDVPDDELDPAWIAAGKIPQRAELAPMLAELGISYSAELNRSETCAFSVEAGIQSGAVGSDAEVESIDLRDITDLPSAVLWQPFTDYLADDLVIDGSHTYKARADHTSGATRDAENWILVGETSYLASRRQSSFFLADRGQAAIAHAVERIRARARIASRCIRVSFEAKMPKPAMVTDDCTVTLTHPRIPGGTVTGRLVQYSLKWSGDDGSRIMSGTIAAAAGTGQADTASVSTAGNIPVASGARVSVSVSGNGEEQRADFNAGTDIQSTTLTVQTTPAASTELELDLDVTVTGEVGIPKQATV